MKYIKIFGGLLALTGLLIGGKALYTFNDPQGHAKQAQSETKLSQEFKAAAPVAVKEGQPFAFIRIPRLGTSWRFTVTEGVSDVVLSGGPGHWPGTALPGQQGRMAVLSHTVGGGDAFQELKTLRAGDFIYIDTYERTYAYVVSSNQVIPATDTAILNSDSPRPSIVLIGCIWPDSGDSSHRQAVTGVLLK